jgi:HK97 gp10 family phage protein
MSSRTFSGTMVAFSGGAELRAKLDQLPRKMRRRILKRAMEAASKPMLSAIKQSAKSVRRFGYLAQSIGKKTLAVKRGGGERLRVIIGPKADFVRVKDGRKEWPAKYAHLVERGTKPHMVQQRNRIWQHPGTPPRWFMAHAYRATKAQSAEIAHTILKAEIVKEFKS